MKQAKCTCNHVWVRSSSRGGPRENVVWNFWPTSMIMWNPVSLHVRNLSTYQVTKPSTNRTSEFPCEICWRTLGLSPPGLEPSCPWSSDCQDCPGVPRISELRGLRGLRGLRVGGDHKKPPIHTKNELNQITEARIPSFLGSIMYGCNTPVLGLVATSIQDHVKKTTGSDGVNIVLTSIFRMCTQVRSQMHMRDCQGWHWYHNTSSNHVAGNL